MRLKVLRYDSGPDRTLGILMDITYDTKFLAYTLEDEHRDVKVKGETRIPSGVYKVELRTVGGFHKRYSEKYKDMHKGMLWVKDVPGFEYILIHTGNTDEHTAGCLLVGNSSDYSKGFIGQSVSAYKRIYPKIAAAIENGEEVTITYVNYDTSTLYI
jgi:hypothetical protein|tara:strand:+ start:1900 stop:2370 length:471 start_codon:yes stop_codon:yes gene_type:complete